MSCPLESVIDFGLVCRRAVYGAGTTRVQPIDFAPATVLVAVAPGHVPASTAASPAAAVMRPLLVPTELALGVTEAGSVQPLLPLVLSTQ